MAITEEREVLVAEAHACGDMVHVNVGEALSVAQSKALRKEMKAAEKEATELVEFAGAVEAGVHEIFGPLLDRFAPPQREEANRGE